ncbi:hypothetical protein Hanom_Chr16g01490121 [Helianthus anomalus]
MLVQFCLYMKENIPLIASAQASRESRCRCSNRCNLMMVAKKTEKGIGCRRRRSNIMMLWLIGCLIL